MKNYPLSSQIGDLHALVIVFCDSALNLKTDNSSNSKARVEAYLFFSQILFERFNYYFSKHFDVSQLIEDYKSFRLIYFKSLNVNIYTENDIDKLLIKRESIYNYIDAKKQESIIDILGQQATDLNISPKPEYLNPDFEKEKNNPLYQLITRTMKQAFQTIKGMKKDAHLIDYAFQKWMYFASTAFSELTYLFFENPLAAVTETSDDYHFIYSCFVIEISNSLNGFDMYCSEVENYL